MLERHKGSGRIGLDEMVRFEMLLPKTGAFSRLKVRHDTSEAVRRVELQPGKTNDGSAGH